MKTFLKIIGFIVMLAALLKGAQLLVDYLYETYGKRYISTEVELDEN